MKKLLPLCIWLFSMGHLYSQTIATDFNVNDCNGNPHHLFSELNSGKIIVLAWTMPCATCIPPIKTAYNVAKSYANSHPNKVVFYMADDYANTNCASVTAWGNNYIGTDIDATFSDPAIKMTDYGSNGMPKIVVLGTNSHTVFYNENDAASGNATAIQNAINQALTITGVETASLKTLNIKIQPNPMQAKGMATFHLNSTSEVRIEVFNLLGERVYEEGLGQQLPGKHQYNLGALNLPSGIYIFSLNGSPVKFMVAPH